ncbi:MAG TPA: hypothetical protein VLA12_22000, partial [Planctomycetaceae bacterium]|nr:hypothetical protein [Planctomycetaceae bacterium]
MGSLAIIWLSLLCHVLESEDTLDDQTSVIRLFRESERAVFQLENEPDSSRILVIFELAELYRKFGNPVKANAEIQRALALLRSSPQITGSEDFDAEWFLISVAKLQSQIDDRAGAIATVQSIEDASRRFYALWEISTIHAESGDLENARLFLELIPPEEGYWRAQIFTTMAETQAKSGDFAAALETVNQIDKLPKNNADDHALILTEKWLALRAIAIASADRGSFQQALDLTETIENVDLKIGTICDVAKIHAGKLDRATALRTLERALPIAEKPPSLAKLELIARLRAEFGDPEGCIQISTKYLRGVPAGCTNLLASIAYQINGNQRKSLTTYQTGLKLIREGETEEYSYALTDISVEAVRANQLDRAIEIADTIGDDLMRSHARRMLVPELLEVNDLENAVRVAESIENSPYDSAEAFRTIAVKQARIDPSKAKQTFETALDHAKAIEIGGGTDVIAVYELGRAQGKAGFRDDASVTFELARKRAMSYAEDSYVAQLFQAIAEAQTESGDTQGALLSAQGQTSPMIKVRSLFG